MAHSIQSFITTDRELCNGTGKEPVLEQLNEIECNWSAHGLKGKVKAEHLYSALHGIHFKALRLSRADYCKATEEKDHRGTPRKKI